MTPRPHLSAFLLLAFLCAGAALNPQTSAAATHRAAGPGDTTIVQTFTFGSPLEGRFLFPDRTKRWEKILMYYTLKCNPQQSPACGEWDYLTYTYLYQHTGRLDSTKLSHPNFLVNNAAVDTFRAMTSPSLRFLPRMEYFARSSGTAVPSMSIGAGTASESRIFPVSASGARSIHLWRAAELGAAGVTTGALTGLALHPTDGATTLRHCVVRVRATVLAEVPDSAAVMRGWTTVYDGVYSSASGRAIPFTWPFVWDGASNILVDVSFDAGSGALTLAADDLGWNAGAVSAVDDHFMHMRQRTEISCGPIPEMNAIPALTLEGWIRPDAFADWMNVAVKSKSVSNRFGMQMGPRNDGNVDMYCLVGDGTNTYGNTTTKPFHAGEWFHVAMVYDGGGADNSARLKFYLNGVQQTLTYTGSIPALTPVNAEKFAIGGPGANSFAGSVDDVRLWKRALSGAEIRERMYRSLTSGDPIFGSLLGAWSMDEGSGTRVADLAGAHDGFAAPPQWEAHGARRFRAFTPTTLRPQVEFLQGNTILTPDAALVIDTLRDVPMLITVFGDTTRANIPTDTLYRWPQYRTYTFDASGRATDSALVAPDEVFVRRDFPYYGPPFEVVNRFELGRFITPYGINLTLGEGWTWIYDVTDFRQLLADSVHLSAGNWQELLDMKFVMVEGTPPRDVINIRNMWNGNFRLSSFAENVQPKTVQLDPATKGVRLRATTTGHEFSNATNCAEFCPKFHWVTVDGTERHRWQIVQECSDNPLHPQGGTWIYDRAGWCPGAPGKTQELELTPWVTGSTLNVHYGCEYDQYGNYVFESQLVEYTAPNFTLDAAIDEIIQPSMYEMHRRFNPICGRPRIVIRNTGATELTSLDIEYGPAGGTMLTHHWTGRLAFLEKEEVYLPALPVSAWGSGGTFRARVFNPNGAADDYAYNDVRESKYATVPVYSRQVYVYFRSNLAGSENFWQVFDAAGNVVMQRGGFGANTLYRDTLALAPGCYEFVMNDAGNDGISFWANNDGTGNLSLRFVGGGAFVSLPGDFGKETRMSFIIADPTDVASLPVPTREVAIYPNPSSGRLAIEFALDARADVRFDLHDVTGRLLRQITSAEYGTGLHTVEFDAQRLDSGIYFVRMYQNGILSTTSTVRIVR